MFSSSLLLLLLLTAATSKHNTVFITYWLLLLQLLLNQNAPYCSIRIYILTGVGCVELVQPAALVVNPGQSFSIACKITGYTAATSCTHWIRHSAGKAPEWLGWFCSTSSTGSKDSLQSKISFTVDASSNTLYLQGQNFQPEDTAVYYCARAHSATHS